MKRASYVNRFIHAPRALCAKLPLYFRTDKSPNETKQLKSCDGAGNEPALSVLPRRSSFTALSRLVHEVRTILAVLLPHSRLLTRHCGQAPPRHGGPAAVHAAPAWRSEDENKKMKGKKPLRGRQPANHRKNGENVNDLTLSTSVVFVYIWGKSWPSGRCFTVCVHFRSLDNKREARGRSLKGKGGMERGKRWKTGRETCLRRERGQVCECEGPREPKGQNTTTSHWDGRSDSSAYRLIYGWCCGSPEWFHLPEGPESESAAVGSDRTPRIALDGFRLASRCLQRPQKASTIRPPESPTCR